jgi:RNA polymerase sigma-70 factor (ECF subfamily)
VRPDPLTAREGLLEHQAFLRRLARSLVADPHAAEDLAQDAAVIALERPPQGSGSLRGWLARVMRNRAIDTARSESSRQVREQLTPPRLPRTTQETEEQLQVQRRVFEAVAALGEPYRTAILLRYYHELGPTEIAAQLGVPVSTVKSRLARALAQLREQLDDTQPESGRAWMVVLAGGLGELHRPAVATALTTGGIAMGIKLALNAAAACGALVLGGWWMLRPVAPAGGTALASEEPVASPRASTEPERSLLREAQVDSGRAPLAALDLGTSARVPGTPPDWPLTLELRGLDERDHGPISIAVYSGSPPLPTMTESRELAESITLELDALFEGVEVRPDQITLLIDHPAYLPDQVGVLVAQELRELEVRSGQLTAAVDLVRAKAIVTGRLEIAPGFMGVEARVAIFAMQRDRPARNPIEDARLDAEGRFRLRADGAEQHAVVAHDERTTRFDPRLATVGNDQALRPDTRLVTTTADEDLDVGTLALGEGESIAGRVRPSGRPASPPGRVRATLQEGSRTTWRNLTWIEGRFELGGQVMDLTDASEFRITGLAPRPYVLSALPDHMGTEHRISFHNRSSPRAVATASATGVAIAVDRVVVTIEVLAEGLPVADAALKYSWDPQPEDRGEAGTFTDREGKVTFELDLGTGLQLEASDPRYAPKELHLSAEQLQASDHHSIELEGPAVETAQLVLVPRVSDPALLEGVFLDLFLFETSTAPREELEGARANPARDVSGRGEAVQVSPSSGAPTRAREGDARTLSEIRAGRYLVCVSPRAAEQGRACFLLADSFELDLPPGQRVVHDWHPRVGGAVRLSFTGSGTAQRAEILGPDEQLVEARYCTSVAGTDSRRTWFGGTSELTGTIDILPALPLGAYTLRIRMADKTDRSIPFQVEAGRVTDVNVDLSTL